MRLELPLHGAWGCFICLEGVSKLKQKRAESPISLQPRATPWVYSIQLTTRPVRATICGTIELPLQGAWFVFVRYPGRCPGLWRNWAFSPHYLHFDTPSCGRHWAFLLRQAASRAQPVLAMENIGLSCLSKRLSRLQNSKLKIANGDNSKLKKEVER